MDHHVGKFQLVQVEQTANAVAILLHYRALAVQNLDGSAQLLMGGKHGFAALQIDPEDGQEQPYNAVGERRQEAEHHHHDAREGRHGERELLRLRKRPGLGQDFREDHQKHGHDDGGVDHAGIAEELQEQAGGERRGKDVDQIVADQQCADKPVATLDQAVDKTGARVAIGLHRVQPGPRDSGHAGFGS